MKKENVFTICLTQRLIGDITTNFKIIAKNKEEAKKKYLAGDYDDSEVIDESVTIDDDDDDDDIIEIKEGWRDENGI